MVYKLTIYCKNNLIIKLLEKLSWIKVENKEEVELL